MLLIVFLVVLYGVLYRFAGEQYADYVVVGLVAAYLLWYVAKEYKK